MNNWCSVKNCHTNFCEKKPESTIIFHRYPTNHVRLKLWMDALEYQHQGHDISLQRVCSRHFLPSDYGKNDSRCLKKSAVPLLELNNDQSHNLDLHCDEINNDDAMTSYKVNNKKVCLVEQCNHSSDDAHSSCSFVKYPKDKHLQSLWTNMLR